MPLDPGRVHQFGSCRIHVCTKAVTARAVGSQSITLYSTGDMRSGWRTGALFEAQDHPRCIRDAPAMHPPCIITPVTEYTPELGSRYVLAAGHVFAWRRDNVSRPFFLTRDFSIRCWLWSPTFRHLGSVRSISLHYLPSPALMIGHGM